MATSLLSTLPAPLPGRTGWPWTEADIPAFEDAPGGSPWPKISVITPSYNQGPFLERTFRSVLLQGYPNLEYIVIDGGSTDGSVSIIERYAPHLDQWVSESDRGQSHAINKGFDRATGTIYAWLNSDDYYLPGALHKVAKAFMSRPQTDVLVGVAQKKRENGDVVYTAHVPELTKEGFFEWRNGGNFLQPACFFKAEAWHQCGPLREDLNYCMDVALWLEMVEAFTFEGLNEMLAIASAHDEAKTTAQQERTAVEVGLLIASYGGYGAARRDLMKLADDLVKAKAKLNAVRSLPLYGAVQPVYRWIKDLAR